MAAISWTDRFGTARLRSSWPAPFLDRFAAWTPMSRDVGVREENPFTGAVVFWRYRTDFGAAFELRGIRPAPQAGILPAGDSPVIVADRLCQHLNAGGLVTVETENAVATAYTCRVMPGAEATLALESAAAREYTVRLALVNVGGAPMYVPY